MTHNLDHVRAWLDAVDRHLPGEPDAAAREVGFLSDSELVSYTPRGVATGGWHRLEVRVTQRGLAVKARPGYLAN